MGNQRSGREPGTKTKPIVEACPFIDVRGWMRGRLPDTETLDHRESYSLKVEAFAGDLDYCRDPDGPYIRFRYLIFKTKEWLDYTIRISCTPLNYGGGRWWFVCRLGPGRCNRRVQRLYFPSGAQYFGCRHCHRLSYASQRKDTLSRHARLLNPATGNEGSADQAALPESFPPKPKGMWGKTYRKLVG